MGFIFSPCDSRLNKGFLLVQEECLGFVVVFFGSMFELACVVWFDEICLRPAELAASWLYDELRMS